MSASSGRLIRAAYRGLLREGRRLEKAGTTLSLSPVLQLEAVVKNYGRGSYVAPEPVADIQEQLFPKLRSVFAETGLDKTLSISGADLKRLVRHGFRHPPAGIADPVSDAFQRLAAVNKLRAASANNTTTVSTFRDASVAVSCQTMFLPALPTAVMEQAQHFPFAYRVRITNVGTTTVQLVSRHWQFEDAKGGVVEVPRGSAGVVGHAPVLEPGQMFEYCSGTQLATPSGSMQGGFQMLIGRTDERFEASVQRTQLTGPAQAAASATSKAAEGKVTTKHK